MCCLCSSGFLLIDFWYFMSRWWVTRIPLQDIMGDAQTEFLMLLQFLFYFIKVYFFILVLLAFPIVAFNKQNLWKFSPFLLSVTFKNFLPKPEKTFCVCKWWVLDISPTAPFKKCCCITFRRLHSQYVWLILIFISHGFCSFVLVRLHFFYFAPFFYVLMSCFSIGWFLVFPWLFCSIFCQFCWLQCLQARILALNASYFLKAGGHFMISIKVRMLFCSVLTQDTDWERIGLKDCYLFILFLSAFDIWQAMFTQ